MDITEQSGLYWTIMAIGTPLLIALQSFIYSLTRGYNQGLTKQEKDAKPWRDTAKFEPLRLLLSLQLLCGILFSFLIFYSCLYFRPIWNPNMTLVVSFGELLLLSLGVGVVLALLSQFIPHFIANYAQEQCIKIVSPLGELLAWCFSPFYFLARFIAFPILKLLQIDIRNSPTAITQEKLKHMVAEGEQMGVIEDSQKAMIHNIFQFDDVLVRSIMTHRTDISAIDKNDYSLDEIIEIATQGGFSRIPVYEHDLDNIIGVLHVKNLLTLLPSHSDTFDINSFIRVPHYIPETASCRNLFDQLTSKRLQLAVVIDEYGGTSGIATLEDVLESIVGEIEDEYDEDDLPLIEEIDSTHWVVQGHITIKEANELLPISPPLEEEEEIETLGGVLIEALGRIPKEGEERVVEMQNCRFTVLLVEESRICSIGVALQDLS